MVMISILLYNLGKLFDCVMVLSFDLLQCVMGFNQQLSLDVLSWK